MNTIRKTVAAAALAGVSSVSFGFGTGNMPAVPSGWTLKESYTNVRIYQKGTEPTYVQVVDVQGGAKVRFVHPGIQYGSWGSYPKFAKYPLDTLWNYAGALSVVNGQFFDQSVSVTPLSFGVRNNWSILTYGQDKRSQLPLKQVDFIDGVGVVVSQPSSDYTLGNTSGANSIVGLDRKDQGKNPGYSIGRMYLCAAIPSSPSKWLIIMSIRNAAQSTADTYLNSWGCSDWQTVMMDGSGSSQLKTYGGITMYGYSVPFVSADKRPLPQVLSIYNY